MLLNIFLIRNGVICFVRLAVFIVILQDSTLLVETMISCLENNCNVFEKDVRVIVYDNKEFIAKYRCGKCVSFSCDVRVHRYRRYRERSRITEKRLRCVFCKSRERRKLAGRYLVKTVPRSFTCHHVIRGLLICKGEFGSYGSYALKLKRERRMWYVAPLFQKRGGTDKYKMKFKFNTEIMNTQYDFSKNVFKGLVHRMAFCKFNLCRDIEKNPGPHPIDSSKTIHAPYCQGDVLVFGSNAGSQCVAMSLCALIYNYDRKLINSSW